MTSPPIGLLCHDPAFLACLFYAIRIPELIENHDRLFGTNLCRIGKPIELAVDDACDRMTDDMRKLCEFVRDYIYLRLSDEVLQQLRDSDLAREAASL